MARGAGHDELRRAVARLDRLDDAIVRTASGPVLLDLRSLRDPTRLLDACRRGALDLAALREGLDLRGEPRPLHATLVARAHRDLKAIERIPEHVELLTDAPRSLRRAVGRGPDWLSDRRRRIDAMRAALAADDAASDLAHHAEDRGDDLAVIAARSPWLASVLDLVAAVHGPASARAALDLLRRSLSRGTASIREPRRRAHALLRRLAGAERRPLAAEGAAELALAELARGALAPGPARLRVRRLRRAVLAALCWPAPPPEADPAPAIEIPEPPAGPRPSDMSEAPDRETLAALRRYADAAASAVFAPLDRAAQAGLDATLAHAALAFRVDAGAPAWGPAERELAARLPELHGELRAPGLGLAGALWLARADLQPAARVTLAPWLAEGLVIADLEAAIAADKLGALLRVEGFAEAQRFCFWLARLTPHFKALGVDLDLDPQHLAALPTGRRAELGLLAHCLLQHVATPSPATVQRDLAALDATLGLFRDLPQTARALLDRMGAVAAGRGRALHPDYADWLGDDDLLDRYCHLRELLGDPPALSNNLRSDFEAQDRLARQVAHLRGLAAPSETQRALLARLADKLERGELPGPEWTRRRMAEQTGDLRVRAFRRQLDAALREVLRAAFGVDLPELSPTWRDVVRFYLGGDWSRRNAARNRQLLGELVRAAAAAPGRPVTRTWPKNLAWIDAARGRFDADAWLRPRRLACRVGARACVLLAEDDPLEVLRMGVPFDTCLSLRGGFNAASTVLNAVDVNKRVLYLRGADGAILARQLLAVSGEQRLLRYHLYSSLPAEEADAVESLFDQVAQDMARETGITPAADGAPAALHGGFWYDDGATVVALAGDDIAALLAERGLPHPPQLSGWERRQLRALPVLRTGDAAAALELVDAHSGALQVALARLAVTGLGEATCRARATTSRSAGVALLLHALHRGESPPAENPERPAAADLAAPSDRTPLPDPLATPNSPPSAARARREVAGLVAALAIAAGLSPHRRTAGSLIEAEALAPADPAIARAWLTAAEKLVRGGDDDDDGLTHHAFNLARHLARLPLGELLDLAERLEALWERFIVEAHYCGDCRERARRELALAAEAAFRRAPDPRAVIDALVDVRGPAPRIRLALHLAARYPLERHVLRDMSLSTAFEDDLHTGAVAAALARLERPPSPCPAAVRALRALERRRPELARTPDFLAACLRHRDPRRPLELPQVPAPLETCAELVLHAVELLAPRADPGVAPKDWRPGRWELALHRRAETPWRRALARAAARGDMSARTWSILLGGSFTATPSVWDQPGDALKLGATQAAACAAATARVIAGEAPDLPALADALRPVAARAPAAIDPAVLAAAQRAFCAAVSGDMPLPTGLLALDLLLADDDRELRLALLDLVLAAPRRPEHGELAAALLQRIAAGWAPLSGPRIVALWRIEGAREALVELLTQWHRYAFASTLAAIVRATGDDLGTLDALLTAWFACQFTSGTWADDLTLGPAPPRLVVRAALAGAGAQGFLQLYDPGPPTQQLELLDLLRELPQDSLAALRDATADTPDAERTTGRRWLAARLADIV